MKLFVAITDGDWYTTLFERAQQGVVEELNFWRPSSTVFRSLQPGELLLFKLHSPLNFLVGGGFFVRCVTLPVRLAWEAFGSANGVHSQGDLLRRIGRYRRMAANASDNISCILLGEPFFFRQEDWIPSPTSFTLNTVVGKTYDSTNDDGRQLWQDVTERISRAIIPAAGPSTFQIRDHPGFASPVAVRPRIGQGSFRVLITEAYNRRCAMTGERTLPALEAAHIRPYSEYQDHALSNGLLLRSDLHRLFDQGYVTLDPKQRTILVSERIKSEFENGREYYRLHGQALTLPADPSVRPLEENLQYHAEHVFR